MKIMINFIAIFTMSISIVFPAAQIKPEVVDTNKTEDSLKMLYDLDINENEVPKLQFMTEELVNTHLSEQEEQEISNEEKNLLARLVHAEAKGEPYAGKVAVAEVVLNRVEHSQFPDTVEEVIYEKNAFEPVQNNSIKEPADPASVNAVQDALSNQKNDNEALYFYNPETATSDWIRSREVIKTIGNHSFAV
jgi:N-acetylmuramoyl-L-alanine amidase